MAFYYRCGILETWTLFVTPFDFFRFDRQLSTGIQGSEVGYYGFRPRGYL